MLEVGNNLNWLNETATPADIEAASEQQQTPPVEQKPAEQTEAPVVTTEQVEVPDSDLAKPSIDSALMESFGGEEGMRQLLPLAKAIKEGAVAPDAMGTELQKALSAILTPDQQTALIWEQYGKYGEILAEQYMADHPEWLQKQGYVQAEPEPDYLKDDDIDDDDLSDRERQWKARLTQQEEELNALRSQKKEIETTTSQQQQAQIVAKAEGEMFGTVVNKTFEALNGWSEDEMRSAYQMAVQAFNADPNAVRQYQEGVQYYATNQAMLKGSALKASSAFAQYLGRAIRFVDAGRPVSQTPKTPAATPAAPVKTEFSTPSNQQQPAALPADQAENPFDKTMLMNAVMNRLTKKAA